MKLEIKMINVFESKDEKRINRFINNLMKKEMLESKHAALEYIWNLYHFGNFDCIPLESYIEDNL